jgi:hypothetical protein
MHASGCLSGAAKNKGEYIASSDVTRYLKERSVDVGPKHYSSRSGDSGLHERASECVSALVACTVARRHHQRIYPEQR